MPSDDEYLAILLAADDATAFEWPKGYDWPGEKKNFIVLANKIETALGAACEIDDGVEDASHIGEIYLPPSLLGEPLLPRQSMGMTLTDRVTISISNWGRFYTIYLEDHLWLRVAEQIKEFMAAEGYVYIPERILKLPYTGPFLHMFAENPTWGHRFFDYG